MITQRLPFCLVLLLLGGAAAAADYVASGSRPHLREGPGAFADAKGRLEAREPLSVIERDGRWVRVRTESGERGWVRASQIRRPL